jgi:hypothetical protein
VFRTLKATEESEAYLVIYGILTHFRIMCVSLEDVVGPQVVPVATEEKMTHVKLQIVIICPQFLHHIYENPGPATTLGRLLQPDRVLAMLLGVDESAVTEQHRAGT